MINVECSGVLLYVTYQYGCFIHADVDDIVFCFLGRDDDDPNNLIRWTLEVRCGWFALSLSLSLSLSTSHYRARF